MARQDKAYAMSEVKEGFGSLKNHVDFDQDLNPRPPAWKPDTLTTRPPGHMHRF